MQAPPVPDNEAQRMQALRSLDVLFTPAEERFDRITRLASRLFEAPITLVSLVADKCQWFKSAQGLGDTELPRETSFCGHAIQGDQTFIVEDAVQDARFSDNPLVTGEPRIRFYAGQPLRAEDGSRVGTLCVIDSSPRRFTPEQQEVLRDLAAIVESELQRGQMNETQRELVRRMEEMQRKSMLDAATRLWNRAAVMELLRGELARAQRSGLLCAAVVAVDDFDRIKARVGPAGADAALGQIAARLRRAVRGFDTVGRNGDAEFVVVLSGANLDTARQIAESMRAGVADGAIETPAGQVRATASIGLAAYKPAHADAAFLVGAAEAALFRAQAKGNRVEV